MSLANNSAPLPCDCQVPIQIQPSHMHKSRVAAVSTHRERRLTHIWSCCCVLQSHTFGTSEEQPGCKNREHSIFKGQFRGNPATCHARGLPHCQPQHGCRGSLLAKHSPVWHAKRRALICELKEYQTQFILCITSR